MEQASVRPLSSDYLDNLIIPEEKVLHFIVFKIFQIMGFHSAKDISGIALSVAGPPRLRCDEKKIKP